MKVLVTGAAGFVGYHVCERLLARGHELVGIDNLNDYYDPRLKQARLARLDGRKGFAFQRLDLADRAGMEALFAQGGFRRVVHLAAQAGVRYSIAHPHAYVSSNLVGFMHVLEGCRNHQVEHLVYASSSSVYGLNAAMPFREGDSADHPVSLYAATKKANELMAHTYSHLYRLPTTGLRFFTVYGPWGRPDMAYWTFSEKILAGEPIGLFNHGRMRRDFTYIDDVAEGVVRTLERVPTPDDAWDRADPDPATSSAPYRIYNIGNNQPVELARFVAAIESALGAKAVTTEMPMQPGDVEATAADVSDLARDVGFTPSTTIEVGMARFCAWFREWRATAR
jgi:UDP-glucuronate 4-epimerase